MALTRDQEYYAKNKAVINARNRQYAIENREAVAAYKAKWYQANKERQASKTRARRDQINARRRERYRENPEPFLAAMKRARDKNPDVNREKCKAYRAENRDSINARRRARAAANPEINKAQCREYYNANKGVLLAKMAESGRKFRLRRPEVHRESEGRRRAQKLATAVEKVDLLEVVRAAKGLCGICKKPLDLFGIEIDHIVPLARGGGHVMTNLQATHAACNRAKGAKVA